MKQLAPIFTLLVLTSVSPLIAGGLSDAFGYSAVQTGDLEAIPFAFNDISNTAPALSLTLNNGSNDDGGALIDLNTPFPFYGSFQTQVVMSTNGYLSFDPADTGGDPSNDAPLPVLPSSGGGPRIYPLHDDLVADGPSSLHYQYFPEGLRNFPLLPQVGVHVFQWNDVTDVFLRNIIDRFSFQTLLFDDGTIHFVYPSGNPELGSDSTTGIQNADASIGLQIAANTQNSIPDNSTATIFPPQLTVTSQADSGPGSLRQAIADAPNPARITFDSTVFNSEANRTIDLTSGQLNIPSIALTIDAQSACGITLDAGGSSRVMDTSSNATTILDALNITGGRAINAGGLSNNSRLTMLNCTLYQNEAENVAGGLNNNGPARLENTTITDNGAGRVGSNPAPNFAGGILNSANATLALNSCTIVANEASETAGGIVNGISTSLTLRNCVLANNNAPDSPNISGGNTSQGGNFVSDNSDNFSVSFPAGNPNTNGDRVGTSSSPLDPLFVDLSGDDGPALVNNGGPTLTLMPLPGSPLIDNSNGSNTGPDQRGISPIGTRDIGAVETTWDEGLTAAIPTAGLDVTLPGDALSNFPPSSSANSLNGAIDNAGSLFFNTDGINSGFTVVPSLGATNLTGITITSNNNLNTRVFDPTSFILLGSNGNDHFEPLASAALNFTATNETLGFTFTSSTPAYQSYRLFFPEIVFPFAGVQVGEVEFIGFPEEGSTPRILDFAIEPTVGYDPPRSTVTITYTSRPDRIYGFQQAQPSTTSFVLDNSNNYTATIAPGVTISHSFLLGSGQVSFTGATAAFGTSGVADFSGSTFTSIGGGEGNPGDNSNADFVNNAIAYTLRDDATGELFDVVHTFFRSPMGGNAGGVGTTPSPDNTAGLVIEVTPSTPDLTNFQNIIAASPDQSSFTTTTTSNFDTVPSAFFRVVEVP